MFEFQGYINWLLEKVGGNNGRFFTCLELAKIEFYASNNKDLSRMDDALKLREDYLNDVDLDIINVESFSSKPITVLEVLIALAIKMEADILYVCNRPRTARWFWGFLDAMGFDTINDSNHNFESDRFIKERTLNFLDRSYEINGANGNIFVFDIPFLHINFDVRDLSLWEQAWKFAEFEEVPF